MNRSESHIANVAAILMRSNNLRRCVGDGFVPRNQKPESGREQVKTQKKSAL